MIYKWLEGKSVRILNMQGRPEVNGRIGKVTLTDDWRIFGTWDSECPIIPTVDTFEVIEKEN